MSKALKASWRLALVLLAIGATLGIVLFPAHAKVTAQDSGQEKALVYKQLVLKDHEVPIDGSTTNASAFGGVKIYDFEEGRILVHGCVADLKLTFPAAQVTNAAGLDLGVGTAAVSDADLTDGTDIDLCAAIAVDPYHLTLTNAFEGELAAAAQFDGTATAKDMYVNILVDAGDFSSSVTGTVNGTIFVTYSILGDY